MSDQTLGKPVEILLVEDNPGDVRLTQEAFKESKILNNLSVAMDGEEAMTFLRREVFAEIKSDERLKQIPVVVLTISKAEEDIVRSYNLSANCYITKPIDFDQFITVVQSIGDFWLRAVKLPPS